MLYRADVARSVIAPLRLVVKEVPKIETAHDEQPGNQRPVDPEDAGPDGALDPDAGGMRGQGRFDHRPQSTPFWYTT